jgi:hypothetical protein
LWGGLVISVVCFVGAGLVLHQWVGIDYDSHIALWSVVWLCVFPVSFFFVSLYAEALFLFASIAAIYFARRGQFVAAGLAIALAGATRPPAFLLAIPYILEFWSQHDYGWSRWAKFGLGALIAPLGALAYLLFLGYRTGSPDLITAYASVQAAGWERALTWPWITLYDGITAAVLGANIPPDWFSRAVAWQDLAYALFGLSLGVWGLFHLRASTAAFLLASVVFLFTNSGPYGFAFYSMPRWIAGLFPIYLVLALFTLRLPGQVRWIPAAASAIALGFFAGWFATGRWVA